MSTRQRMVAGFVLVGLAALGLLALLAGRRTPPVPTLRLAAGPFRHEIVAEGVLVARRGSQSVRIAFRHGQVVSAVGPDHEGPLVVYDFIGWPQGQFEFDRDAVIEVPSIAADFNALLLEGCRRLDERRRGRPIDSTPAPPLTHPARLA